MTRQNYSANGTVYTISPDVEQPAGQRTWAVVRVQLVDEITGTPPRGAISLGTAQPHLTPRVAEDGLAGLVGIPAIALSELAATNYDFSVTLRTAGYVPVSLPIHFPSDPAFPGSFAPVDLGTQFLHRQAIILAGRVLLSAGITDTPIGGATLTLTGVWRTPPPANLIVPPSPPNLVSLQPPLYFARTAAAGLLRGRNMAAVAGQDKQMLEDADAGTVRLHLSDQVGLAVGDVIAVDPDDPERTEYMTIQTIAGASTPDQPANVFMNYPLQGTHRRSALVRKMNPQPPGPNTPLTVDAIAGDACVFLATLANLGGATVIEVFGGANPSEYHGLGRFAATSDANGFYRLPPISRIAQGKFLAHDGVHPDITVTFAPDYSSMGNRLDFVYH